MRIVPACSSISAQVAEGTSEYGMICCSNVDMRLEAYESTVQQRMHSILASLNQGLEELYCDDAWTDPQ